MFRKWPDRPRRLAEHVFRSSCFSGEVSPVPGLIVDVRVPLFFFLLRRKLEDSALDGGRSRQMCIFTRHFRSLMMLAFLSVSENVDEIRCIVNQWSIRAVTP